MTSIEKRLKAIQEKVKPSPLHVLAENADGEQVEVTATECISKGFEFVKVTRGGNIGDLDQILAYILRGFTNDQLQDLADGTGNAKALEAEICQRLGLDEGPQPL
jgi:hypothetical protein